MQKIGVDKQKMVCGLCCRVRRLSENEGCARGLRRNAGRFHNATQMCLAQDNHMIDALSPDRPD
jgi:hypothetical protein